MDVVGSLSPEVQSLGCKNNTLSLVKAQGNCCDYVNDIHYEVGDKGATDPMAWEMHAICGETHLGNGIRDPPPALGSSLVEPGWNEFYTLHINEYWTIVMSRWKLVLRH